MKYLHHLLTILVGPYGAMGVMRVATIAGDTLLRFRLRRQQKAAFSENPRDPSE